MMVILSLNDFNGIFEISIPSIEILPASISTILVSAKLNVLFPAPVLPTTPILWPP